MNAAAEELVYRAHDAFTRGDREGFVECWVEDCEYRPALEHQLAGEGEVFRGHEGIRRWWDAMAEAWRDLATEVREVRSEGDRILVTVTLRGEGRLSGAEIEATFFQVPTIRDGRIAASRDFADRERALAAAGLG